MHRIGWSKALHACKTHRGLEMGTLCDAPQAGTPTACGSFVHQALHLLPRKITPVESFSGVALEERSPGYSSPNKSGTPTRTQPLAVVLEDDRRRGISRASFDTRSTSVEIQPSNQAGIPVYASFLFPKNLDSMEESLEYLHVPLACQPSRVRDNRNNTSYQRITQFISCLLVVLGKK